jgi:lycopene cyclase domain-containing protein
MTLETNYLYLLLLLFSLSYPLAQSFEWRISYYKKWKHLLKAILVMMLIFIPWDIWKTVQGVWWFDDNYILGFKIGHLPIEEWLFFVIVPFACVFIYEVLNYYLKKDYLKNITRLFFGFYGVIILFSGIYNYDKLYPFITFSFTGVVCLMFCYRNSAWLGRFLMMYFVSLLPFLLINGALTGMFTSGAVVNYNPNEFLGIRIFTIPIEDSVYGFLMLLITVAVYERSLQKK